MHPAKVFVSGLKFLICKNSKLGLIHSLPKLLYTLVQKSKMVAMPF